MTVIHGAWPTTPQAEPVAPTHDALEDAWREAGHAFLDACFFGPPNPKRVGALGEAVLVAAQALHDCGHPR